MKLNGVRSTKKAHLNWKTQRGQERLNKLCAMKDELKVGWEEKWKQINRLLKK